jgi:hypothetical protein
MHLSHATTHGRSHCGHRALPALAIALLAIGAAAQTPDQASIAVTAVASASPPAITFSWPLDATATGYTVARRLPGAASWGTATTIPGAGTATSWVDTGVVKGQRYEYWFAKTGTPAAKNFVTSGIQATAIEQRGKLLLIVDATHATTLAPKLARLAEDLTGDGWVVLRHDVLPTDSVASVKALIAADVAADPVNTKAVFLFGHVPVPYSGYFFPDGHTDHLGAWPADVYYGELDGTWTDTTVNTISASRPENRNVPGDGKFDQSFLPSNVDLIVGRVDLANMPAFASSEQQLLANYLDKDHDYRHGVFTAQQRAVIDDNFGWFGGEAFAASGWRNFSTLLGAASIATGDYFTTLNTPSGAGYVWSYACGGGWYDFMDGVGATANFALSTNRNVFTMMFGSYFGDWDSTNNLLRAPLCSGWTLADVWAGRPHWSFHPMGMGETIGASARYSQNDTTAGGLSTRGVHMALMGDPTLRQHVIAPPTNLVVGSSRSAPLSWTASTDAVAGYHVYLAATAQGPFTRLTRSPITVTQFTDTMTTMRSRTYMVRAVRLETTPTGSYWNLSQGALLTLSNQPASHADYGVGCNSLTLSAAPAPISTPTGGTLVTYTIANLPETAPGSGAYAGTVVVSLTPVFGGTPVDSVSLPGCSLYVGSPDVVLPVVGNTSTLTAQFQIAAGTAYGTKLFATAIAMSPPASPPSGEYAVSAPTSNGVASFVSDF